MRAVIVGGGVGGLAAGIALTQRGHNVQVLEQAPELTEVGAGLQISPNGCRVLKALGILPEALEVAFSPRAIEMRFGQTGARVFSLPLREYAQKRWGAPYIHIHRADLVAILARRLEALAPGAIKLSAKFETCAQASGRVHIHCTDSTAFEADVLIGADGLRSAVRETLFGPDAPRFTGHIAWRAVVAVDALAEYTPPETACVWVGHKRHAVTTRLRAGRLANFVGVVEETRVSEESWYREGAVEDVLADFDGWNPVIRNIIGKAEVLHKWALFDRAPLPRWSSGHVTLMGDAAHPMLPSMAQGAVQALEDAWILAELISKRPDTHDAVMQYEMLRKPRTTRIQRGSAGNARLFHHASPLGQWAVYRPMALAAKLAPDLMHRRQDWVYSYNPLTAVEGA